jgi:uncharacterized protein
VQVLTGLLKLQELDLRIETCVLREREIPKQKSKFEVQRSRLEQELKDREEASQRLALEQRECYSEIDLKQEQAAKYEQQLHGVKKNEEYQALLHEIDLVKKQVAQKEERIISLMVEMDDAEAKLEEDKKRIGEALQEIDDQCAAIDEELAEAVKQRGALEAERVPLVEAVDAELMPRYTRIRANKGTGAAVVPLNGENCGGCHMAVPPQVVNEVLGNAQVHTCAHCGRLLYSAEVIGSSS